jgi:mRNA interferase HicA
LRLIAPHLIGHARGIGAGARVDDVLDPRTYLTELISMTAGEFIRRIGALGAARGVPVRFDKTRGKGSHGTLYYGERFTVVKDRRKECGPGLINKMLADLGLRRRDLR